VLTGPNYVLLNDGTGRLYAALHGEFTNLANDVYGMLNSSGYSVGAFNGSAQVPKFIAIPQSDGSLSFVAEMAIGITNPSTGLTQSAYAYVNVPLQYNPSRDFVNPVTISDRRGSTLMRTWAGDDTIYDKNAAVTSHIDGGLGSNTCVYSGNSSSYTITHNSNGTYTVSTSGGTGFPALTDTLINIQKLQFSDKVVTLN